MRLTKTSFAAITASSIWTAVATPVSTNTSLDTLEAVNTTEPFEVSNDLHNECEIPEGGLDDALCWSWGSFLTKFEYKILIPYDQKCFEPPNAAPMWAFEQEIRKSHCWAKNFKVKPNSGNEADGTPYRALWFLSGRDCSEKVHRAILKVTEGRVDRQCVHHCSGDCPQT